MICQICGGILIYLGTLGKLVHSRCRNCGMTFSHKHYDGDEIEAHEAEAEDA